MDFLTTQPDELIQAIALHVPFTVDLFSLSLVNKRFRNCLTDPVLFKWRLQENGWDVGLWEKDTRVGSDGLPVDDRQRRSNRWFRIDYIHSRTEQLLDQAIADGEGGIHFPWGARDDSGLPTVKNGSMTLRWLENLACVLPAVVHHHTSRNVPRVTEVKYWPVWDLLLQSLNALCSEAIVPKAEQGRDRNRELIGALEGLALSIGSVFHGMGRQQLRDLLGERYLKQNLLKLIQDNTIRGLFHHFDEVTPHRLLMRHRLSSVLLASSNLRLMLLAEYYRDAGIQVTNVSTLPPSPPGPGPCVISYDWTENITPGYPQFGENFAYDKFAPLDFLVQEETSWIGYYSKPLRVGPRRITFDPMMTMNLKRAASSSDTTVVFEGSGVDGIDSFTLQGTIDLQQGAVEARKSYANAGHSWKWMGFGTPFGLIGRWGQPGWGGWWWIWPAEWSPKPNNARNHRQ
ncbi:hypothetical protein K435DRAFT_363661 [Dendrothele bispora CBS 962.96]|uniref:Uncharacterized protein n=1 Tax=Dendrothele bispora (strain CBS 962.96) TaxID=1314807 RepID=A0A4S8LCE6_DENBC|nr:hypothetical protein K435DRAFT_363661 [Dendrothele bispora CBS 962.96]